MVPRESGLGAVANSEYAVSRDFCRIFAEEMDGLYTLSLLLTAEPSQAEKCFSQSLEDCLASGRVFQGWAHSWARRAVIQNAVRIVRPAAEQRTPLMRFAQPATGNEPGESFPLAAILNLKPFDRFAFVMSTLEQFSDQECAVLLGCSRREVVEARNRAIESLAELESQAGVNAFGPATSFQPGHEAAKSA